MGCTSSKFFRALSVGLALSAALVTAGASASPFGSPSDANSCYSDCGKQKRTTAPLQNCYCDADCESKGDCCADKHEWCSPAASKPFCSIADVYQKSETSSPKTLVCGSDLGFSFIHEGRIELVFGDTWEYQSTGASSCVIQGADGRPFFGIPTDYNDDSQARLPGGLTKPGWVPSLAATALPSHLDVPNLTCNRLSGSVGTPVIDWDKKAVGSASTYQQIRLKRQPGNVDIEMGLVNTPLTAFSDGVGVYGMFVANPPEESPLDKHVYVAKRRTGTDAVSRTTYDTIKDLGRYEASGGTTKFLSTSSTRIGALRDSVNTSLVTSYDTPTTAGASNILIWGRPRFISLEGQDPATNAMYLMRLQSPAGGLGGAFVPTYFDGLDAAGRSKWTSAEHGQPVLTDDFRVVNHFDIKWISQLKKWVMLYGGDIADWFDPPTTVDQPRHGAIHMRTADHPWGPWSKPTPVLWREQAGRYLQCDAYDTTTPMGCDRKFEPAPHYLTGDWESSIQGFVGSSSWQGQACQTVHPRPATTPNLNTLSPFCPVLSQRGNLYGPSMLPTWTQHVAATPGNVGTTTIYFNVSTWYPYDVLLAAVDLKLPRTEYPLQLQIRNNGSTKMIAGTTVPTFSGDAGGTNGGQVAFRVELASGLSGKKMMGDDVVVLRNVSSNKLLARSGETLVYVTPTSPVPETAKWKIKSAAPQETLIGPENAIRLETVTAPTRYVRSAGSPAQPALGADDASARWRFTYRCEPGDNCLR